MRTDIFVCLLMCTWWSEVAQLCLTLCNPMDYSLLRSSVHGIFQARVLEWVAISFSRGSSWPRDRTQVSRPVGRCFTVWATREVQIFRRCYQNEGKGKSTRCDPVWSQWPSRGASGRRSQTIMEKVGKLRRQGVEYWDLFFHYENMLPFLFYSIS